MDKLDRIGCVIWLSLSVFVCMSSLWLGVGTLHNPGSGFILFWTSIFLAFFTSLLFLTRFREKSHAVNQASPWKGLDWGRNIIVIAALVGYSLLLQRIGYLITTFGLMLVLFGLGKMKLWLIILSSLVTVLLSYSLFGYIFGAPLPRGILGF